MAKGNIRTGITVGNGAAINVELGWIPTHVQLFNATDGTLHHRCLPVWVVPFTSGGTAEISPGSTIKGLTSKAVASVRDVLLYVRHILWR